MIMESALVIVVMVIMITVSAFIIMVCMCVIRSMVTMVLLTESAFMMAVTLLEITVNTFVNMVGVIMIIKSVFINAIIHEVVFVIVVTPSTIMVSMLIFRAGLRIIVEIRLSILDVAHEMGNAVVGHV